MSASFSLLSLNTWGYHSQASKIKERFQFIAQEIKRRDFDVVALQEVWDKGDYQLLVKALGSHYPYNYYFYNGNVGSGLCLFSKFPIVEAHGLPFRIFQGAFAVLSFKYELFLGKGCLSCRLKTPVGYVRIYVLHTGTDYTHRMCQLYEAIQYVSSTSGEDPVIWCGDFNMIDDEPPYKLITETLGMKDAFEHNRLDTCSLPDNVWSHTWINKVYPPCRLDYVFYANNGSSSLILEGFDSKLTLDGFVPGENYNYSDHSGIEVKFRLNKQHLSSVSRSSLRERFNGDILNSQLRRSFCDTLLSMKAHLESYKDPRLLCSLSRNPPLSFSILSLLLTVPLMFFFFPVFSHPFLSLVGFGAGMAVPTLVVGIISDMRRQYKFEDLKTQMSTKLQALQTA